MGVGPGWWEGIAFLKANVCGNDFVVVRADALPEHAPPGGPERSDLARWACARGLGLGADQLLVLAFARESVRMEIWNPDGSLSPFCGNACLTAARLHSLQATSPPERIQVHVGEHSFEVRVSDEVLTLKVPTPSVWLDLGADESQRQSHFFVDNGTWHRIVLGDRLESDAVARLGEQLSVDARLPGRTNVMFISDAASDGVCMTPWERGGTGLSLACASGAAAAAWVLSRLGRADGELTVRCPGGELQVGIHDDAVSIGARVDIVCQGRFVHGNPHRGL
jgi:diaminopimelate epimerase